MAESSGDSFAQRSRHRASCVSLSTTTTVAAREPKSILGDSYSSRRSSLTSLMSMASRRSSLPVGQAAVFASLRYHYQHSANAREEEPDPRDAARMRRRASQTSFEAWVKQKEKERSKPMPPSAPSVEDLRQQRIQAKEQRRTQALSAYEAWLQQKQHKARPPSTPSSSVDTADHSAQAHTRDDESDMFSSSDEEELFGERHSPGRRESQSGIVYRAPLEYTARDDRPGNKVAVQAQDITAGIGNVQIQRVVVRQELPRMYANAIVVRRGLTHG